jgi:hypothetical protein
MPHVMKSLRSSTLPEVSVVIAFVLPSGPLAGPPQAAYLLGIAVGEQFHRPLEIGEQDGDLLALALESSLRGEDLLGEVAWSIAVGGKTSFPA